MLGAAALLAVIPILCSHWTVAMTNEADAAGGASVTCYKPVAEAT